MKPTVLRTPRFNSRGFSDDQPQTTRSTAVQYAKMGFAVVPMYNVTNGICTCHKRQACTCPGKHPTTISGVKDASIKKSSINRLWSAAPNSNIGIATGVSGLLVLDVDPRNGGAKTLARLIKKLGPLNASVSCITGGGGQHYYFSQPNFRIPKDSAGKILGPGLDILTGNSIVIAAPSVHASGKKYTWHSHKSLLDAKPSALPKKWRDYIRRQREKRKSNTADHISVGLRNVTLTVIAGKLHNTGISNEGLLEALRAENKRCVSPLSDAELTTIVRSIGSKPISNKGSSAGDLAERVMKLVLEQKFNGGERLLFCGDERFWHFKGTHWQVIQEAWLRGQILETLPGMPDRGGTASSALLGQVVALMKASRAVGGDPLRFNGEPPPVINCLNGEVWIGPKGEVRLRPHSATSYLRHCLRVAYDPRAQCPRYDTALKETFRLAKPTRKGMVRHWNELMGYMIQPRRHIPTIVILRGGGGNGKTVLMNTAVRLLGDEMVSAQRIEALENQFAVGSLLGKLLLMDDDVKDGIRLSDGQLKKISEEKTVTGELKHGPSFNFKIRTLPVLLCNNVPSLGDLSLGMRRRLMVIPFDCSFSKGGSIKNPFEKIWKNEMSGVLNRAIAGLRRVLRRGTRFRTPEAVTAAGATWLVEANPLPAFIEERCKQDPKVACTLADFYAAYTSWSVAKGYTRVKQSASLNRSIQHLGFTVTKRNRGQTILGLKPK